MPSQHPDRFDRYLALVFWAQRRYARNGRLVVSIGRKPSVYSRIEAAAAARHLGVARRVPGLESGGARQ